MLLRSRLTALGLTLSLTAAVAAALAPTQAVAAATPYTLQTLHFRVLVGPDNHPCDVIGDLYLPTAASATHRVPAVLTSNGFGGSKDDQAGLGKALPSRGYAVLSYSGLGFGGSTCKISLDDPAYDGKAGKQLVSYLGGATGIAFLDAAHTQPAPVLRSIVRDRRDHLGRLSSHDPRVGMIGGSYGGGNQFATASVDPRVDTIIPIITWNDLSYSLDPNNTDQTRGVTTKTPGTIKLLWGLGFSALGMSGALQDPSRLLACPNFADWVCPALVTAGTTGFFQPDAVAAAQHASVGHYISKIRIPVLLMQGQNDTLFNLNEAVATYRGLRAQGTPVKMVWHSWGHSGSAPAPGEISLSSPDPQTQYETRRILNWLDHYLQNKRVGTGPQFAWFRDWVKYSGIATPAYATASAFPVGSRIPFYLSGDGTLASKTTDVTIGSASFVTPVAGLPTSLNPMDVIGGTAPVSSLPTGDQPGTFASWSTPALTENLDVVGSPKLHLEVVAPFASSSQASGPAGCLVLFVKVLDVAPDGTASMIHGLEAPVRVPDATEAFEVTLPGIVHRFAVGHRLQLVVAGGSVNYRGGLTANPVLIASGASQVLTLPVTP
jgi:hypothetical protein